MKKFTLVSAALLTIAFTSCKKDYTCECKDDNTGDVYTTSTFNATKPNAKISCESLNIYGAGITCKLK